MVSSMAWRFLKAKKRYGVILLGAVCVTLYLSMFQTDHSVSPIFEGRPKEEHQELPKQEKSLGFEPHEVKLPASNPDLITQAPSAVPLTVHNLLTIPTWVPKYLPHIKSAEFVYPRIKWSQGRRNVSLVIGIPTIKRPSKDSYILNTIQSFFDSMTDAERRDVIIIVSVTEPWDLEFESKLLKQFRERFPAQLEEGSLEVIAPHKEFYPDLDKLKLSLGDPKSRVKWRSKQNLDYGFLMMHSMGKGQYYLQMEDDISTVKGFVSSMKNTLVKEKDKGWIFLCFSELGYIGRLYRIQRVRGIMEYLVENFDQRPCDWLQYDYLRLVICPPNFTRPDCDPLIGKYSWLIKPTLFQHKGFRSSFKGVINKLQDKYFPQGKKQSVYSNPPVKDMLTSLEIHQSHKLATVYRTKGFFWGKNPREGDTIEFLYDPPITVNRITIVSGQPHHPNDVIMNATLEILPAAEPDPDSGSYLLALKTVPLRKPGQEQFLTDIDNQRKAAIPALKDARDDLKFYSVGEFKNGLVEAVIQKDVGKVRIIRVRFGSRLDHWVIMESILVL